ISHELSNWTRNLYRHIATARLRTRHLAIRSERAPTTRQFGGWNPRRGSKIRSEPIDNSRESTASADGTPSALRFSVAATCRLGRGLRRFFRKQEKLGDFATEFRKYRFS